KPASAPTVAGERRVRMSPPRRRLDGTSWRLTLAEAVGRRPGCWMVTSLLDHGEAGMAQAVAVQRGAVQMVAGGVRPGGRQSRPRLSACSIFCRMTSIWIVVLALIRSV